MTRLTWKQFRDGLIEYQARLGFWGDGQEGRQRRHLEAAYGHMHHKRIEATQVEVGGISRKDHKPDCPCNWCLEWDRDDDSENRKAGGKRWRLDD